MRRDEELGIAILMFPIVWVYCTFFCCIILPLPVMLFCYYFGIQLPDGEDLFGGTGFICAVALYVYLALCNSVQRSD